VLRYDGITLPDTEVPDDVSLNLVEDDLPAGGGGLFPLTDEDPAKYWFASCILVSSTLEDLFLLVFAIVLWS